MSAKDRPNDETSAQSIGATAKGEPRSVTRRKARVAAVQALFEADVTGHDPFHALQKVLSEGYAAAATLSPEEFESEQSRARHPDESLDEAKVGQFARRLLQGVVEHRADIDQVIEKAAPAWPLAQMPPIDKSILRLAIYEVLFDNKSVPLKAAINEAVEIAKLFGSENTSKFINGVLGTVAAGRSQES